MLTKSQKLLFALIRENGGVDDKTKLAKLEYFADFIHYAFHDSPISGEDAIYTAQKQGPLSRTLTTDLEVLKAEGLIEEKPKYNYAVKRHLRVDLTAGEVKTIKFVIERYGKLSYSELINISHGQIPYLSARDGEIVEFVTAYNLVDEYPEYAR
jgi:uncharacterized phage-associated protein